MLEQYLHINEALGINIHLLQNGDFIVNACMVTIADKKLYIGNKIIGLTGLDDLVKHYPGKANVALNLTGKGILIKKVEKINEINQQNFSQILPNANFNDFYTQNFISGSNSFVSVIRKSEADKWINAVKDVGFIPLMLTLGPFAVEQVIPQLNLYDNDMVFAGNLIQRDENLEWVSCSYKENELCAFPLKLESEIINENLVVAYASAFQLALAQKINLIQAAVPALKTEFNKLLVEKKLKVSAFIMLAVFFVLLLINFVVFSWLNSANSRLTDLVSKTTQSTNNIQGITDQVKDKEFLLQNLGWDGGVNKSTLVDQLASLLPVELSLKEITINPVDASVSRIQKSLHFVDRSIRIVGYSQKIIPVNEWIARIKIKKWVKNIQLDSYLFNSELNTGQFTVLIEY